MQDKIRVMYAKNQAFEIPILDRCFMLYMHHWINVLDRRFANLRKICQKVGISGVFNQKIAKKP